MTMNGALCAIAQELPTCGRSSDKLVMIYIHLGANRSLRSIGWDCKGSFLGRPKF